MCSAFLKMCLLSQYNAPNMTGFMTVTNLKGEVRAIGAFTYDSTAKKLRFRSNESTPINTSLHLDLLVFFEEGILYEIDSKNQSCEKKKLQCNLHPLDIPDDATFMATMTFGSPSVEGEGIKLNLWTGSMRDTKGGRDTMKMIRKPFCDVVLIIS
uniref:Ependymin-1-like n=1 Tax=Acanthochromis polyacanthus TaxID=80966 RepID=A0A3Q1HXJ0_9TELE